MKVVRTGVVEIDEIPRGFSIKAMIQSYSKPGRMRFGEDGSWTRCLEMDDRRVAEALADLPAPAQESAERLIEDGWVSSLEQLLATVTALES